MEIWTRQSRDAAKALYLEHTAARFMLRGAVCELIGTVIVTPRTLMALAAADKVISRLRESWQLEARVIRWFAGDFTRAETTHYQNDSPEDHRFITDVLGDMADGMTSLTAAMDQVLAGCIESAQRLAVATSAREQKRYHSDLMRPDENLLARSDELLLAIANDSVPGGQGVITALSVIDLDDPESFAKAPPELREVLTRLHEIRKKRQ